MARARAGVSQQPVRPSLARKVLGTLSRAATFAWRSLYWPDPSCLWYFPARAKALALVHSQQYDVVVSVSPTFTAVAIGRHIREASQTAVWMLDLGDPFSFLEGAPPNNATLYGRLNKSYERKVFQEADVVSLTNSQTLERYAEVFPESAHKLLVIPPLLSLPHVDARPLVIGKLVYVGTMYRNIREPGFLLELFKQALQSGLDQNAELHCFGDVSSCVDIIDRYEELLGKRVFFHGVVSRDIAAQAMEEAHILVNIGNDTTYQLPSKVVEYAATGKPIINLAKTPEDSSVRFFTPYPCALNLISDSPSPTEDQVCRFVAFMQASPERVNPLVLADWLHPYTSGKVVADYLEAMIKR